MSRHLSARNISFKSMLAFLSNRAHRQTNELWRADENIPPPLSEVKKQNEIGDIFLSQLAVTAQNSYRPN